MARILIIDDDKLLCQSLLLVATRRGHEVTCAHTLADGVAHAHAEPFDVVFLDVRMPDGNGLEVLPALRNLAAAPEIIIMTGYGDPHGAELAIRSGVWDYLEKGATAKEITLSLHRALQYRRQKQEVAATAIVSLKRDGIVGSSPLLERSLDLVAQAAKSDASVLIVGATGTGKELFARAVHQNSGRSEGEFVVVDCAALPDNLIESILFGHQKGAFTGADQAREGLIRQAHGGTLFLDEVGELPIGVQKAFLRVLQERRYRQVGSSREEESDFRLVAATNRNLDDMCASGTFRSDLLFRLRSFLIELPTLQERPEDIKPLARHYADRICERSGLALKGFSPDFMRTLAAYSWPGNVRELVNALEQTIAAARFEPVLFPKHLPVKVRIEVAKSAFGRDPGLPRERERPEALPKLHDFRDSVCTEAERHYLQDLMEIARNDINAACRISGVSLSRLYALLKKQGITLHQ